MDTNAPYICNNKARPVEDHLIEVQDGWITKKLPYDNSIKAAPVSRIPKMVMVQFRGTVECCYDKSEWDSRCKGCAHALHLHNNINE